MSRSNPTLVEGIDYYIEAGRWVFTAAHHRNRGLCCEHVCRHCPFGNSPTDREQAANGGPPRGLRESECPLNPLSPRAEPPGSLG